MFRRFDTDPDPQITIIGLRVRILLSSSVVSKMLTKDEYFFAYYGTYCKYIYISLHGQQVTKLKNLSFFFPSYFLLVEALKE